MRKNEKKSFLLLFNFALSSNELKKLKGGNGATTDAQGNIIIEDIING